MNEFYLKTIRNRTKKIKQENRPEPDTFQLKPSSNTKCREKIINSYFIIMMNKIYNHISNIIILLYVVK